MQFQTLFISFLPALAAATNVSYYPGYDEPDRSLAVVACSKACSDGPNGIFTKGFTTQASLPHFPLIGGASTVASWDSANCGNCYSLTYQGRSINVLAVDHADMGFNIAKSALDQLTVGKAAFLGQVEAAWAEVAPRVCGV
ncbi:Cerato-platanin [Calycina marina]|uniref:Cerato-platanin n=1 Tax=Calycina marina TaxID=1763456 RepID=A0A9P7Z812_9HELO|nr:Cerato-platanin [Calycina marina]